MHSLHLSEAGVTLLLQMVNSAIQICDHRQDTEQFIQINTGALAAWYFP